MQEIVGIINKLDNPWDFQPFVNIGMWNIKYKNLMEIGQGSPLVGHIYINGKGIMINKLFGGPFLFFKDHIYIPMFVRKFCISGFIICDINLMTESVHFIGKIRDLIFLDCIENNFITYYSDANKTIKNMVELK